MNPVAAEEFQYFQVLSNSCLRTIKVLLSPSPSFLSLSASLPIFACFPFFSLLQEVADGTCFTDHRAASGSGGSGEYTNFIMQSLGLDKVGQLALDRPALHSAVSLLCPSSSAGDAA
jgi:hypothetical protein